LDDLNAAILAKSRRTLVHRNRYLLSWTRSAFTTNNVTAVMRFRGTRNKLIIVDLCDSGMVKLLNVPIAGK